MYIITGMSSPGLALNRESVSAYAPLPPQVAPLPVRMDDAVLPSVLGAVPSVALNGIVDVQFWPGQ